MPIADSPIWLFVSYGAGHVNALLPVAKRVMQLGIARPIYLALTSATEVVRASGVPMLGFQNFLADADDRARAKGLELADELQMPTCDREESIAYLGMSYVDLEDRLGPAEAAMEFRRYGRQAFLPLGVLHRILQAVQPALVITTNSPRAEQAALQSAQALGVPSACVVDLLGIWERGRLAQPGYADALCVLNAGVRDCLVAAGRPHADVFVTGNPAFDTIQDAAFIAQGARYRTQAGWDSLHVFLYASSPEPSNSPGIGGIGDPAFPRRIEQALIDLVRSNARLALWVRRHPTEPLAAELLCNPHPRIKLSTIDMPLHASLHACDEVVVTVSTVGVEAHLAGKVVTQVRGSILDHLSPYCSLGLADRELSIDQLSVLGSASAEQKGLVPMYGSAIDRVVDVLRSVAQPTHGRQRDSIR
jgi:hypothetical protein